MIHDHLILTYTLWTYCSSEQQRGTSFTMSKRCENMPISILSWLKINEDKTNDNETQLVFLQLKLFFILTHSYIQLKSDRRSAANYRNVGAVEDAL